MKQKRFEAKLLSGHKESAVEVPFDPAETAKSAEISSAGLVEVSVEPRVE